MSYIGIFPVNLRIVLIFTDFPNGSWSELCALLEIYKYQGQPSVSWKNDIEALFSLM